MFCGGWDRSELELFSSLFVTVGLVCLLQYVCVCVLPRSYSYLLGACFGLPRSTILYGNGAVSGWPVLLSTHAEQAAAVVLR